MLDEKIIKKGGRSIKRIKWDIEKAKAYFAGHGLDVIDNKFVNVRTPLTFRDKDGYISSISVNNLRSGQGYFCFAPSNPYVVDNVRAFLKNNNSDTELLSSEFVSNATPMLFKCGCGNTFMRTWGNMSTQLQLDCPDCALAKRVSKRRNELNDVVSIFAEHGLKMLSDKYENNMTVIDCETMDGYRVCISLNNLMRGKTPTIFSAELNPKYFEYNMRKYIVDNDVQCEYVELIDVHGSKIECRCDCGNLFNTTSLLVRNNRQTRCQKCSKKQSSYETKTEDWLIMNGFEFYKQHRFDDCKDCRTLPFDFYLPSKNICIEVDGEQHHREHSIYYSGITIQHDSIKDEYCKKNGMRLIRIPFSAYNKRNEYKEILSSNIL